MAESSTMISLPQMCDLALNTPEVGIVNFSVLHSLLHVMINQMGLTDTNIEFRGTDSERMQNFISSSQPANNALTLTEYTIEGGGAPKERKRVSIEEKGAKDENQKEKKDKPKPTKTEEKKGRLSKDLSADKDSSKSTIVLVQSSKGQLPGAQFSVALTKENFEHMLDNMEKLENRVKELEELPTNSKLMEALMSDNGEKTPVLDMFQILTLQKKMDAAEKGIEKLASMIEGVARGSMDHLSDPAMADVPRRPSKDSPGAGKLEERVIKLEKAIKQGGGYVAQPRSGGGPGSQTSLEIPAGGAAPKEGVIFDLETVDISQITVNQALGMLQEQLLAMKSQIMVFPQLVKQIEELEKILTAGSDDQPVEVRLKLLEAKFEEILEQVDSLDNSFSRQVNTMQNHLGGLDKNMGELLEKVHLLPEDGKGDNNITAELHSQLSSLAEDFINVSEAVQKLSEDRDNKQHALEVMVEQIELLKTVKADREDLEDALADKADACQINRKVSFEQFDQACGDMSKNLEEALAKLTQQENLWNEALQNIQGEIGGKLDKNELNPLRDFINSKLKGLQEKFKTLNAMKKENEAAGTKSKYLRNVNCISCDKDVVMRKEMDPSMYPQPNAVPPTRSMGPYLAYELDQLRKQQKCLPNSKNMNVLENALQSNRVPKSLDHVCNRYCGGSHTVTTPQQRVTRLGHFLEQWGPELSPTNDAHVRGTDGRMYKARDDVGLTQLATERPPTPHNDNKPSMFVNPSRKSTSGDPAVPSTAEHGKKSLVDQSTKHTQETAVNTATDTLK